MLGVVSKGKCIPTKLAHLRPRNAVPACKSSQRGILNSELNSIKIRSNKPISRPLLSKTPFRNYSRTLLAPYRQLPNIFDVDGPKKLTKTEILEKNEEKYESYVSRTGKPNAKLEKLIDEFTITFLDYIKLKDLAGNFHDPQHVEIFLSRYNRPLTPYEYYFSDQELEQFFERRRLELARPETWNKAYALEQLHSKAFFDKLVQEFGQAEAIKRKEMYITFVTKFMDESLRLKDISSHMNQVKQESKSKESEEMFKPYLDPADDSTKATTNSSLQEQNVPSDYEVYSSVIVEKQFSLPPMVEDFMQSSFLHNAHPDTFLDASEIEYRKRKEEFENLKLALKNDPEKPKPYYERLREQGIVAKSKRQPESTLVTPDAQSTTELSKMYPDETQNPSAPLKAFGEPRDWTAKETELLDLFRTLTTEWFYVNNYVPVPEGYEYQSEAMGISLIDEKPLEDKYNVNRLDLFVDSNQPDPAPEINVPPPKTKGIDDHVQRTRKIREKEVLASQAEKMKETYPKIMSGPRKAKLDRMKAILNKLINQIDKFYPESPSEDPALRELRKRALIHIATEKIKLIDQEVNYAIENNQIDELVFSNEPEQPLEQKVSGQLFDPSESTEPILIYPKGEKTSVYKLNQTDKQALEEESGFVDEADVEELLMEVEAELAADDSAAAANLEHTKQDQTTITQPENPTETPIILGTEPAQPSKPTNPASESTSTTPACEVPSSEVPSGEVPPSESSAVQESATSEERILSEEEQLAATGEPSAEQVVEPEVPLTEEEIRERFERMIQEALNKGEQQEQWDQEQQDFADLYEAFNDKETEVPLVYDKEPAPTQPEPPITEEDMEAVDELIESRLAKLPEELRDLLETLQPEEIRSLYPLDFIWYHPFLTVSQKSTAILPYVLAGNLNLPLDNLTDAEALDLQKQWFDGKITDEHFQNLPLFDVQKDLSAEILKEIQESGASPESLSKIMEEIQNGNQLVGPLPKGSKEHHQVEMFGKILKALEFVSMDPETLKASIYHMIEQPDTPADHIQIWKEIIKEMDRSPWQIPEKRIQPNTRDRKKVLAKFEDRIERLQQYLTQDTLPFFTPNPTDTTEELRYKLSLLDAAEVQIQDDIGRMITEKNAKFRQELIESGVQPENIKKIKTIGSTDGFNFELSPDWKAGTSAPYEEVATYQNAFPPQEGQKVSPDMDPVNQLIHNFDQHIQLSNLKRVSEALGFNSTLPSKSELLEDLEDLEPMFVPDRELLQQFHQDLQNLDPITIWEKYPDTAPPPHPQAINGPFRTIFDPVSPMKDAIDPEYQHLYEPMKESVLNWYMNREDAPGRPPRLTRNPSLYYSDYMVVDQVNTSQDALEKWLESYTIDMGFPIDRTKPLQDMTQLAPALWRQLDFQRDVNSLEAIMQATKILDSLQTQEERIAWFKEYNQLIFNLVETTKAMIGKNGEDYLLFNEMMLQKYLMNSAESDEAVKELPDAVGLKFGNGELDHPEEVAILQSLLIFLRMSLDPVEMEKLQSVQTPVEFELWQIWRCLRMEKIHQKKLKELDASKTKEDDEMQQAIEEDEENEKNELEIWTNTSKDSKASVVPGIVEETRSQLPAARGALDPNDPNQDLSPYQAGVNAIDFFANNLKQVMPQIEAIVEAEADKEYYKLHKQNRDRALNNLLSPLDETTKTLEMIRQQREMIYNDHELSNMIEAQKEILSKQQIEGVLEGANKSLSPTKVDESEWAIMFPFDTPHMHQIKSKALQIKLKNSPSLPDSELEILRNESESMSIFKNFVEANQKKLPEVVVFSHALAIADTPQQANRIASYIQDYPVAAELDYDTLKLLADLHWAHRESERLKDKPTQDQLNPEQVLQPHDIDINAAKRLYEALDYQTRGMKEEDILKGARLFVSKFKTTWKDIEKTDFEDTEGISEIFEDLMTMAQQGLSASAQLKRLNPRELYPHLNWEDVEANKIEKGPPAPPQITPQAPQPTENKPQKRVLNVRKIFDQKMQQLGVEKVEQKSENNDEQKSTQNSQWNASYKLFVQTQCLDYLMNKKSYLDSQNKSMEITEDVSNKTRESSQGSQNTTQDISTSKNDIQIDDEFKSEYYQLYQEVMEQGFPEPSENVSPLKIIPWDQIQKLLGFSDRKLKTLLLFLSNKDEYIRNPKKRPPKIEGFFWDPSEFNEIRDVFASLSAETAPTTYAQSYPIDELLSSEVEKARKNREKQIFSLLFTSAEEMSKYALAGQTASDEVSAQMPSEELSGQTPSVSEEVSSETANAESEVETNRSTPVESEKLKYATREARRLGVYHSFELTTGTLFDKLIPSTDGPLDEATIENNMRILIDNFSQGDPSTSLSFEYEVVTPEAQKEIDAYEKVMQERLLKKGEDSKSLEEFSEKDPLATGGESAKNTKAESKEGSAKKAEGAGEEAKTEKENEGEKKKSEEEEEDEEEPAKEEVIIDYAELEAEEAREAAMEAEELADWADKHGLFNPSAHPEFDPRNWRTEETFQPSIATGYLFDINSINPDHLVVRRRQVQHLIIGKMARLRKQMVELELDQAFPQLMPYANSMRKVWLNELELAFWFKLPHADKHRPVLSNYIAENHLTAAKLNRRMMIDMQPLIWGSKHIIPQDSYGEVYMGWTQFELMGKKFPDQVVFTPEGPIVPTVSSTRLPDRAQYDFHYKKRMQYEREVESRSWFSKKRMAIYGILFSVFATISAAALIYNVTFGDDSPQDRLQNDLKIYATNTVAFLDRIGMGMLYVAKGVAAFVKGIIWLFRDTSSIRVPNLLDQPLVLDDGGVATGIPDGTRLLPPFMVRESTGGYHLNEYIRMKSRLLLQAKNALISDAQTILAARADPEVGPAVNEEIQRMKNALDDGVRRARIQRYQKQKSDYLNAKPKEPEMPSDIPEWVELPEFEYWDPPKHLKWFPPPAENFWKRSKWTYHPDDNAPIEPMLYPEDIAHHPDVKISTEGKIVSGPSPWRPHRVDDL